MLKSIRNLFAHRQPIVDSVTMEQYQVHFVTYHKRRWVTVQTEGKTVFSSMVYNRRRDYSKSTLQNFVLNTPSWLWGHESVLKGLSRAS